MSPRTLTQTAKAREEKRKIIEDAALEVFAEDGYHHASISKIATRAGVSKGLMYNYFENKEELLKELIRDIVREITDRFDLSKNKELDDEKVIQFIQQSLQLVRENPVRWKLFFSMFLQKTVMELMQEEMMAMQKEYIQPFMDYFEAKGSSNAMATLRYFHASIDGVQMQIMMDPKNFPVQEVEKMIIDQFIK